MSKNALLKLALIAVNSLAIWSLVFFTGGGIKEMWEAGESWAVAGFVLALLILTWTFASFDPWDNKRGRFAPWTAQAVVFMSYSFLMVKSMVHTGRPELFFMLGVACCAVAVSEVTAEHAFQGK